MPETHGSTMTASTKPSNTASIVHDAFARTITLASAVDELTSMLLGNMPAHPGKDDGPQEVITGALPNIDAHARAVHEALDRANDNLKRIANQF